MQTEPQPLTERLEARVSTGFKARLDRLNERTGIPAAHVVRVGTERELADLESKHGLTMEAA